MDTGSYVTDPQSARLLILLFNKTFTASEHVVLHELLKNNLSEHTITSLGRKVADESSVSQPTARRTLKKLRDYGIINSGDKENQGKKVRLTKLGKQILRGYSIIAVHEAPDLEAGVQFPLTPSNIYKE